MKISILVIISDIFQTIILLNFFVLMKDLFRKLMVHFKGKKTEKKKTEGEKPRNKLKAFMKKHGTIGLITISALPYGGGALTGSLIAVSLKIPKFKAFIYIIIGCIIGTSLYYLIFSGVLTIFK